MPTIRCAQVDEPGGSFRIVERERPEPGQGQVRIAVEACGICRSDEMFVENQAPGITFPLVTGHEIAGRIDAVGAGVAGWETGERVTVGWFGGNCGVCRPCRAGDFIHCVRLQVPGWAYPGGYAEAVVVPATAPSRVPDALTAVEAAPMGCAGVTTFTSLRNSPARGGDLVAVLGIGGLGHLGVQFASKLGFETVAIARGDRAAAATELGAAHYIDSTAQDVAATLQDLGGAAVVLATAGSSEAMGATIDGLGPNGVLIVVGIDPAPIPVSPLQLVTRSTGVYGHPSGTARDVEETTAFAALTGVRAYTETRPLDQVDEAYQRMLSGKAHYRMVLTME